MSLTIGEAMALHRVEQYTSEASEKLDNINRKMDKQIALLEKMVEILTKVEERKTDADY